MFVSTIGSISSFAEVAAFVQKTIEECCQDEGIPIPVPIRIEYTAGPDFEPISGPTDIAMTFSDDDDGVFIFTIIREDQADADLL